MSPVIHIRRHWFPLTLIVLIVSMFCALRALGRQTWGINNVAGLWTSNVDSSLASQLVADPYTLSHLLHGIVFFAFLWWLRPQSSLRLRFVLATIIEIGWEIIENTNAAIEHYRAATISLHYYGDSIVNSMGDLGAMMIGFLLASWLPRWMTIVIVLVVEAALLLTIRDSFLINVIMLIHPIPALKAWQLQA